MHKKKIITATSLILAAVLIVGTFAWTNFAANITNVFTGLGTGAGTIDPTDPEGPGGTLHNDHADGEPHRDVYIENWGTEPLIVRINLSEYMEIGPGAGIKNDPVQNQATSLVDGALIDDVSSWTPFNGALEPIHLDNAEGDRTFRHYWRWLLGGQKYFFPAPAEYRTDRDAETQFVSTNSPWNISGAALELAQQTLNAEVLTMSEWVEQGEPMGNYWVVDTDGFSYWAAPLAPGDATGLLLHKVELINPPAYDYFYAINVAGHMATVDDSPDNYERMIQDASSDAERLIRMLADSIRGGETPPTGPLPARSVRLSSLEYYSSDQSVASPWVFHDEVNLLFGRGHLGDVFVSGHSLTAPGRWFSSRDYLLDGQFSRINGRLFPVLIGTGTIATSDNYLAIYGDGVRLYSSNVRASSMDPHTFDIDVSGVSVLRIEFVFERESALIGGNPIMQLGISDTQLLRKPTSEPLPTPTPGPQPIEPVRLSSIDYFTNVLDNASLWMGPGHQDFLSSSHVDELRDGFSYRNYVIHGQYSRITGTASFGGEEDSQGNYFVIWGDGRELYRSPELGSRNSTGSIIRESSFDLDISGVSDLTIGFEFGALPQALPDDPSNAWRRIQLGILDTQLIP